MSANINDHLNQAESDVPVTGILCESLVFKSRSANYSYLIFELKICPVVRFFCVLFFPEAQDERQFYEELDRRVTRLEQEFELLRQQRQLYRLNQAKKQQQASTGMHTIYCSTFRDNVMILRTPPYSFCCHFSDHMNGLPQHYPTFTRQERIR